MDSITQRAQAVATLVTNDTTPTLKGTAVAGTTVKLYDVADDGTRLLVGSTVASAKGTWSITSTLLTESTHSFIATSTDSAGQISAPSVSFQLIVDITPPAKPAPAQIMDNAGDVTGAVSSGGVMDDPVPVIKGTGEAGAKVKIFDNGTTLSDGFSSAMAVVGTRTQSAQYAAELSANVAASLENERTAVSGVNQDEEAARLLQFQQAYQASAKVIQIAQSLFDNVLNAVNG